MAIAATHLTRGTDSDGGDTASTASISPGGNRLILVAVAVYHTSGPPAVSSVIGNGITYELIEETDNIDGGFGPYRLGLYRGMAASPSSGAITITCASSATQIDWAVVDFSGVDTGGTNGSAAVVQDAENINTNGNTLTVTLAAFGDAGNGAYGAIISYGSRTFTPGTGWTELSDSQLQTQWRADNDTTCDWTASGAADDDLAGIAIEIKSTFHRFGWPID